MTDPAANTPNQKTTSWKVIVPFYGYAALSFLVLTLLLLFSTDALKGHYFQPRLLAITHMATLGWGTMIILGASHQLIPVLVDGKLYSDRLANATFWCTAAGIPLLVCSFWHFTSILMMQAGAVLVLAGLLLYTINTALSIPKKRKVPVQVYFLFTASLWLCLTAIVGTLLVLNFTYVIFREPHLHYLRLHAHMGLAGWFLLLVMGVGSRLIPMFMISKYTNDKLLWRVYALINLSLTGFITDSLFSGITPRSFIYLALALAAVLLFVFYCYKAWQQRIRKKIEEPVQLSLAAVALLLMQLAIAAVLIVQIIYRDQAALRLTIVYGSLVLLGWTTALILGMTFKTLPFIIWNKVYHHLSGKQATPSPKDLFSMKLVKWQMMFYLPALALFEIGILLLNDYFIKAGAVLLLLTAIIYNLNVGRLISHKVKTLQQP
jgi:hypothetical protein